MYHKSKGPILRYKFQMEGNSFYRFIIVVVFYSVWLHCFFKITITFSCQCQSSYHMYYAEAMPTKLLIVPLSLSSANEFSSYSSAIGLGAGTPFSAKGEGSITGVKVWEHPGHYIAG